MNKLLDGNMLLAFTRVNLTGFILSSLNISVKLSISFDESSSANGKIPLFNIDEYITNCKKIIIHNLLSYYKTKISQYTTTVNKIESKMDDFLS